MVGAEPTHWRHADRAADDQFRQYHGDGLQGLDFLFVIVALGAILDRAYQDAGNRKWLTTIAAVAVHVAITCCLVTLVDAMCNYGPEPGEVCRKLSWQIVAKMNGENQQADFLVDDIQLTRTGRRSYSGFVDVTRHDEQERLSLRVTAKPF